MKINRVFVVILSILLIIFMSKGVNAYINTNLYMDSGIDSVENIFIVTKYDDVYSYEEGRLYYGWFDIYDNTDDDFQDEADWIIIQSKYIYEYGDGDPWGSAINLAYKGILYDYYQNEIVYFYVRNDEKVLFYDAISWTIDQYYGIGCNILSFVSAHPRNYNNYDTLYGNGSASNIININHDYYFSNLKTQFGNNTQGSCGYIAIAIILSYNDIFKNDLFVDDDYVYDGSQFGTISTGEYFDTSLFEISPGHNDSLHRFLINQIGINELGYSNNPLYSTTSSQRNDIIEKYLTDYTNIPSSNYTISHLTTESDIKVALDNNNPVIMSINTYECIKNNQLDLVINRGHAVIVYGYIELSNGETLYRCHMGWHTSGHQDYLIKIVSYALGDALIYTASINNCNDNAYIYTHDDCDGFGLCYQYPSYIYYLDRTLVSSSYDDYYCPICHEFIMQGMHIHNRTYTWRNYTQHQVTCPCGYTNYEVHTISGTPLPGGYYRCADCGGLARMGILPNNEEEEN